MEYNIGDLVLYPMHGAGVIEAIEEKEILGKSKSYYVMRMPVGDLKVMIPLDGCEEIGLRGIIDKKEADNVISCFRTFACDSELSWNRRYRENMAKIKSGDVYEVAQVVKLLMCRDKDRGLSTGERKMLNSAKQILVSELVLAKNIANDEIERIINEIIEGDEISVM